MSKIRTVLSKYHTYDPINKEHHYKYPYYPAHDEYKMTYPTPDKYNFPSTPVHESPCMSEYWRAQPIRQGKVREEIDFDYIEEDDELTDD